VQAASLIYIMVAAIVHDVGHDGMNNSFHKVTASERALAYNDQSIQVRDSLFLLHI
jgi:hypothetical protein